MAHTSPDEQFEPRSYHDNYRSATKYLFHRLSLSCRDDTQNRNKKAQHSDPRDLLSSPLRTSVFRLQALALFGFGEDKAAAYTAQTTAVIEQVRYTLELPPSDDGKAAAIEKTRNLTNAWVARYRRDKGITGKPSYGQVYSALNAVSGHYNNFGTKYPLPVKRKERVLQEFATAEIALSRGR